MVLTVASNLPPLLLETSLPPSPERSLPPQVQHVCFDSPYQCLAMHRDSFPDKTLLTKLCASIFVLMLFNVRAPDGAQLNTLISGLHTDAQRL